MQVRILVLVLVLIVGGAKAAESEPVESSVADGAASAAPALAAEAASPAQGAVATESPAAPAANPEVVASETAPASAQAAAAEPAPANRDAALSDPPPASPEVAVSETPPAGSETAASETPPASPEVAVSETAPVAPAKGSPVFNPEGTIHVVENGDTLWDISDLYLGTPWIWPSLWSDNTDIEDPHLIRPGDRILVSATEMRKLTPEEVAALLAGDGSGPAAMAEDLMAAQPPPKIFHFPGMRSLGVVTKEELKGVGQIVGTPEEQVLLVQDNEVFINLGEGSAEVGDRLAIFETTQMVREGRFGRRLGYHTRKLGWLEVTKVHREVSRARIREAYEDVVPGNYLKPLDEPGVDIEVVETPDGLEGQLVDVLVDPKYHATGDIVFLNRGTNHGLQPGSPVEVYRQISDYWKPTWYGRQPDVYIPHEVVAELVVITAEPKSAAAIINKTSTELKSGDRFRSIGGRSLYWPPEDPFWEIKNMLRDLDERIPRPNPDNWDVADWNLPRLLMPRLDDPR